jgi:hypothetical protein
MYGYENLASLLTMKLGRIALGVRSLSSGASSMIARDSLYLTSVLNSSVKAIPSRMFLKIALSVAVDDDSTISHITVATDT